MASIRQWHNGYQVRWRDPAGRQRTKTFKRKTDAKQFSNRVEVEMQRGTYATRSLASCSSPIGRTNGSNRRSTCAPHRGRATRVTCATTSCRPSATSPSRRSTSSSSSRGCAI